MPTLRLKRRPKPKPRCNMPTLRHKPKLTRTLRSSTRTLNAFAQHQAHEQARAHKQTSDSDEDDEEECPDAIQEEEESSDESDSASSSSSSEDYEIKQPQIYPVCASRGLRSLWVAVRCRGLCVERKRKFLLFTYSCSPRPFCPSSVIVRSNTSRGLEPVTTLLPAPMPA